MEVPNCIAVNHNTGMTHYATCDPHAGGKEPHTSGKVIDTFCGRPVHDNYEIFSRHFKHVAPNCKLCDHKERMLRGHREHWLNMDIKSEW